MKPKLIILINPVSLHRTFCEKLNQVGIKVMALHNTAPSEGYFSLERKHFTGVEVLALNLKQDLQKIKQMIQDYDLVTAIPAFEAGFEYAEQLAYALSPESANNPQNSYLRFKKYEMNEALKQAGLNAIAQIRISPGKDLPDHFPLRFPVVVKPSYDSAGSAGVKVCQNRDEVIAQLQVLQHSKNVLNQQFSADIAIQEKIEGVEHFVDSVSWQGKHYITAIFNYNKVNINGLPIYRFIEFVNPHKPVWQLCYNYALNMLDALKLNYGFAHTEFILTKENQPYLMELNPRLSGLGGQINRLSTLLTGKDQSDVFISLIQKEKIADSLIEGYQQQHKYGRIIFLFSWKETIFKGFRSEVLQGLTSNEFHVHLFKPEGSVLTRPKDLLDVVMTIVVVDESFDNIIRDTKYLQQLEQEGSLFNE